MKAQFVPKLTHPCQQNWSAMHGDDQKRFCDACQLHVHNISAMTATEKLELFATKGRRCIAWVKSDETIQVHAGWWLWLQRLLRPWQAGLAMLAAIMPFAFTSCATPEKKCCTTCHTDAKEVKTPSDGKIYVGGVQSSKEPGFAKEHLLFSR